MNISLTLFLIGILGFILNFFAKLDVAFHLFLDSIGFNEFSFLGFLTIIYFFIFITLHLGLLFIDYLE